jgi:hypothetical protein
MLSVTETQPVRSWVEELRSCFEARNDRLVSQTSALLSHVIGEAALHSRLTNTLSLLEHMGSHKIMTTQHGAHLEHATLRHVAEEAQHAAFMRRQAERIAGHTLEYVTSDLLAPAAARMYFQRLEARVLQRLRKEQSAFATYLYVSMVIELRALWFYGLYAAALREAGHAMSLKRILGEEEHHLCEMAERLEAIEELDDARVGAFVDVEQRLYAGLLSAMRHELEPRLV